MIEVRAETKAEMVTASAGSPGRRVRKRSQTRMLLQRSAVELFEHKGYENVTVAEIANAADVDVTTFWRHFGSKIGIFLADFEDWLNAFRETLEAIPPEIDPFNAAIASFLSTPRIEAPAMEWLQRQIDSQDATQEVQYAVLTAEDKVKRVLAEGLAKRMGVDPDSDHRPFVLADLVFSSSRWARFVILGRKFNPDGDVAGLNLETIINSVIALVPKPAD